MLIRHFLPYTEDKTQDKTQQLREDDYCDSFTLFNKKEIGVGRSQDEANPSEDFLTAAEFKFSQPLKIEQEDKAVLQTFERMQTEYGEGSMGSVVMLSKKHNWRQKTTLNIKIANQGEKSGVYVVTLDGSSPQIRTYRKHPQTFLNKNTPQIINSEVELEKNAKTFVIVATDGLTYKDIESFFSPPGADKKTPAAIVDGLKKTIKNSGDPSNASIIVIPAESIDSSSTVSAAVLSHQSRSISNSMVQNFYPVLIKKIENILGITESNDTIDFDPKHTPEIIAAFIKIYKALHDSQPGLKNNFLENKSAENLTIDEIQTYIKNHRNDNNTAEALKLAKEYYANCNADNMELFSKIYQCSFNNRWFGRSHLFGSWFNTIYKRKTLKNTFDTELTNVTTLKSKIEQHLKNDLKQETRTAIIYNRLNANIK